MSRRIPWLLGALAALAGYALLRPPPPLPAADPAPLPEAVSPEPGTLGPCKPTGGDELALRSVVSGLRRPVLVLAPPGDERLFVLEQEGAVRVVADGALLPEPFLDLRGDVALGNPEQGLLGMAFHPRYPTDPRFWVHYSERRTGATLLVEHRVDPADPNRAEAGKGRRLLRVEQPWGNHNGGQIAFSPIDGHLYLGLGDGGAGGDPRGNGQNPSTRLGSILRLDVDSGGDPYAIPADNPFASGDGGAPEVWAWGLRNPWRFSFDPDGGDLYIGDVGQNAREEIDWLPAGARAGANFGWDVFEGTACYDDHPACDRRSDFVAPAVEFRARPPCNSITGGHVYRGACLPDLVGTYFWSDYCHDFVRSFRVEEGRAVDERDWTERLDPEHRLLSGVSSFGVDGAGELYLVSHRNGIVYRLVANSPSGG